jgi:hypothetical protein
MFRRLPKPSLLVFSLQRFNQLPIQLEFIQRAPIRFRLRMLLFGFDRFGFTNPITVSVAVGMRR